MARYKCQSLKKGLVVPNRNEFDNIDIHAFIADRLTMKSITVKVGGWFYGTTTKEMLKLKRVIKKAIYQHRDSELFKPQMIDIDTIPDSFDDTEHGYVSFEYTLFYNKPIEFNRKEQIVTITDLATKIYQDVFEKDNTLLCFKNKQKL